MNLGIITNNHDIALELCDMLEKEFNNNFHHSDTIFSADAIEKKSFVDVLELLLYLKSTQEYDAFATSLGEYRGIRMNDIPDSKEIFKKFLDLIGEKYEEGGTKNG